MYTVYNNVEGKIVFNGGGFSFISFMKTILKENGDSESYSIIGEGDAMEYLEDYCGNLDLLDESDVSNEDILKYKLSKVENVRDRLDRRINQLRKYKDEYVLEGDADGESYHICCVKLNLLNMVFNDLNDIL